MLLLGRPRVISKGCILESIIRSILEYSHDTTYVCTISPTITTYVHNQVYNMHNVMQL